MGLASIPTKIIEKAENLFEKKMDIAFQLTQLIHKENKDETEVLETFSHCLNHIKEFLPQDQTPHLLLPHSGVHRLIRHRYVILLILAAMVGVGAILYTFFSRPFEGRRLLDLIGISLGIALSSPVEIFIYLS